MSDTDHVRRLGGALGWSVAARVARVVLGLIGSVLVVRGLGPHEYGILAVLRNTLAFVLIVVTAGLTQAVLRYFHIWRTGNVERFRRVLGSIIAVQVVLWVVSVGFFWVFRDLLTPLSGDTVAGLLILGTALLLPEVLANTTTQVANALYDARGVSFGVAVSTIAYVALVAWLLDRGGGISAVLIAGAVSNAVLCVIISWRVRQALRHLPPPTEDAPEAMTLRGILRYSAPFLLIGLLNLITWRQSEVLFLGYFRSAGEAGAFDLAYRLPQMILEFVPGAIWPLVMAGFAEVYSRDNSALQRSSDAYYKLLFLLVAPLSVGGVLTGDLAVRLLYGSQYEVAGPVCQVFFIIFSVSFLATPLSMVLYILERPGLGLAIYAVNAVINVGLDLILIPRYGVWGAVIPVSVVILLSPWPYLYVLRRLGVAIGIPWRFLGRIYGASGLMFLLWPIRGMGDGFVGLGVLVGMGVVLFVLGVRIFRVLGREELELFDRAHIPGWRRLEPLLVAGRNRKGRS